MTYAKVEKKIGSQTLSMETGKLAKQADGAVVIQYGDSVVLVTAQWAKAREGIDFFPLTVEYREKMSAGGRFPGGFIKREGRPSQREILTMRQIDRPIRPLFPEGYIQEVQIIGNLLSADRNQDPDILALCGASAALSLSSIPFLGPIGGVRVGRMDGEFVINPTAEQLEKSDLDLVVAGTSEAVVMVEAGAKEVSEAVVIEAIQFAHEVIREIVSMIQELQEKAGKPKQEVVAPEVDEALVKGLKKKYESKLQKALRTEGKLARYEALDALRDKVIEAETESIEDEVECAKRKKEVKKTYSEMSWKNERSLIIDEGTRSDGRKSDEIRAISCEVGILPRTHGSALFTRGETQALVTAVLGTEKTASQRVENVMEDYSKSFYLDYNFPPFSVGEVRPIRGVGRREIGHGALAERAVSAVIPEGDQFSYTVRVVSEILESNGSSSMATVCGATLSMMDAGVPIKSPVAGIAMGLVMDGDRYSILSDIAGSEDHNGDMDFKVAGTKDGITALQMDIKVGGLTVDILVEALEQAKVGRMHILGEMLGTIEQPRDEVSEYAPRLDRVQIPSEKIGVLIGPGGRQIKAIQEDTGANIEVNDDGVVLVSGDSGEIVAKAMSLVRAVTAEIEVGQVFDGKIVSIKDFGAFVEVAPGQEGLCHVSELDTNFVSDVTEVVTLGEVIKVKVINVDPTGRIKLSRKALLEGGDSDDSGTAGRSEGGSSRGPREGRREGRRDDRGRGDGRRDDRPRGDRPRGDRPRDDRGRGDGRRDDRPRGDRPRGDRPRDDRPRDDRPRDDRPRDDRSRDDRGRDDRSRDDRGRGRSDSRGDDGRRDDRGHNRGDGRRDDRGDGRQDGRRDHRGDGRREHRQVDSSDRRPAQDSDRWNDSKSSDKLDEWEKPQFDRGDGERRENEKVTSDFDDRSREDRGRSSRDQDRGRSSRDQDRGGRGNRSGGSRGRSGGDHGGRRSGGGSRPRRD